MSVRLGIKLRSTGPGTAGTDRRCPAGRGRLRDGTGPEDRPVAYAQAFERAVERDWVASTPAGRLSADREAMVLAGDLDLPAGEVLDRVIRAAMAKLHLHGLRAHASENSWWPRQMPKIGLLDAAPPGSSCTAYLPTPPDRPGHSREKCRLGAEPGRLRPSDVVAGTTVTCAPRARRAERRMFHFMP